MIHDTSTLVFSTERAGLGRVTGGKSPFGFFAHVSLAASFSRCTNSADTASTGHSSKKSSQFGQTRALGLVGVETWTRGNESAAPIESETAQWMAGVRKSSLVKSSTKSPVVHVMDREADSYGLMSLILDNGDDFVIRAQHNRNSPKGKIRTLVAQAPVTAQREVELSQRTPKYKGKISMKSHPPRAARSAKLQIRACSFQLPPSGPTKKPKKRGCKTYSIHCVHVSELNPPKETVPVDWLLWTSKSVDTPQDVLAIVDIYRGRWLIEELFKSLKTGCGYQKQQLTTYDALARSLGCMLPVAVELLRLKSARESQAPANELLDSYAMLVLRTLVPKLPQDPTEKEVVYAVAGYGGHFKHNGPPGWQTIGKGITEILTIANALRKMPKDVINL